MINIKDGNITRNQITDNWPTSVMYGDINVFNAVYATNISAKLDPIQKDGNGVCCDSQEVYLGYIPSMDLFVMGFDCWLFDEDGDDIEDVIDNVVYFQLTGNGQFNIKKRDFYEIMIYSKGDRSKSPYNLLHEKHKDLLDIRLD